MDFTGSNARVKLRCCCSDRDGRFTLIDRVAIVIQFLVLFCELSAAPPAPSKLTYGRVRKDSVTLEWETSAEVEKLTGLSGYLIEKREALKETWTPVKKVTSKTRTYEVPGLLTGREYMFRVRPIGTHGYLGDAIMPERPVTVTSQYSTLLSMYELICATVQETGSVLF